MIGVNWAQPSDQGSIAVGRGQPGVRIGGTVSHLATLPPSGDQQMPRRLRDHFTPARCRLSDLAGQARGVRLQFMRLLSVDLSAGEPSLPYTLRFSGPDGYGGRIAVPGATRGRRQARVAGLTEERCSRTVRISGTVCQRAERLKMSFTLLSIQEEETSGATRARMDMRSAANSGSAA